MRRRGRTREADARRGRRRARGGGRGEGGRTVHAARVRASIAIAAEVQPRRAGASARARPARGAARDAIAELDKGTTSRSKTARGGEGVPRAASPASRRDALRRLRRRRRSPGDEMARARPPCSPRSETTERARSSVRPSRAEVLSIGSRARLEASRSAEQIDELRTRRFITFDDTSSPKALLRSTCNSLLQM